VGKGGEDGGQGTYLMSILVGGGCGKCDWMFEYAVSVEVKIQRCVL